MLYAEDSKMPLPTQEEVLICTHQTTAEEVGAFKFVNHRKYTIAQTVDLANTVLLNINKNLTIILCRQFIMDCTTHVQTIEYINQ